MDWITTIGLALLVIVCVVLIAAGLFHASTAAWLPSDTQPERVTLTDVPAWSPFPVEEPPIMAKKKTTGEVSSARLASIAARALKAPSTLTMAEIRALAASVLTQRPNK